MSAQEEEFLRSLRATFKVEAVEHLQSIAAGLLALEKSPSASERRGHVETVFRAAHSLKGAARAVNFAEVESICQSLENTFAAWKRQETVPSRHEMDALHRSLDAASEALDAPEQGTEPSGGQAPSPPVAAVKAASQPARVEGLRRWPRRLFLWAHPKKLRLRTPCAFPSPNCTRSCWRRRKCWR
jgi:two-component system chemotaxis sensor kinase CheA